MGPWGATATRFMPKSVVSGHVCKLHCVEKQDMSLVESQDMSLVESQDMSLVESQDMLMKLKSTVSPSGLTLKPIFNN